jgi:hypothetical protein
MAVRTVRLDDDAEKALARLRRLTGLSISQVLKRGLAAYEQALQREAHVRPYDVYARLDLGGGGWSLAPSDKAKAALRETIRRKHAR